VKEKKAKILFILSLLGLVLSLILLVVDVNAVNQVSNTFCNISNYINCDRIALSPYSHIGAVPLSLIGVFFYFFIALYAILHKESRLFYRVSSWLFLIASLGSVFLLMVSVFQVGALCIFCIGTYLVNWIGMGVLRKDLKAGFNGFFGKENLAMLALSGVLALILAGAGYWVISGSSVSAPKTMPRIIEKYNRAQSYQVNTIFTPYKGSNDPKISIVVYSDFFCGHCRTFSHTLDQVLETSKYGEVVRVYLKPYTLDQSCTAAQPVEKLSKSCKAALIGFDMMKKGLFWEYEKMVRDDPTFSEEAVLDAAKKLVREPLNIKQIKKENIKYVSITSQEGRSLGITGTPTWFIEGKKIVGAYGYGEMMTLIDYILREEKQGK
jgi:uncharacterized membrane protein/protein-disulfide isomerase